GKMHIRLCGVFEELLEWMIDSDCPSIISGDVVGHDDRRQCDATECGWIGAPERRGVPPTPSCQRGHQQNGEKVVAPDEKRQVQKSSCCQPPIALDQQVDGKEEHRCR